MVLLGKCFVLASTSPRRLALLRLIGIDPVVIAPRAEEVLEGASPEVLAVENALAKAYSVVNDERVPKNAVVLGADTLVAVGEEILGKASDSADVRRFLRLLSGRWHRVVTGVAIKDLSSGCGESFFVVTWVRFRELSEEDVDWYVASGEGVGKAGGYAIQGLGSVLIEEVRGDPYNVAGLPLSRVYVSLRKFGVEALKPSNVS